MRPLVRSLSLFLAFAIVLHVSPSASSPVLQCLLFLSGVFAYNDPPLSQHVVRLQRPSNSSSLSPTSIPTSNDRGPLMSLLTTVSLYLWCVVSLHLRHVFLK